MDNSLKIGAVSGLIAGLVYGIIFTILAPITASSDAYYPFWQDPLSSIVGITILQTIIWGAILGLIYAKVFCVIPGKDILRGIIFALIIYLIKTVKKLIKKYYDIFGDLPYLIVYNNFPESNFWHFHIEIFPKIKIYGGFEYFGLYINEVLPEYAAKKLRF